MDANDAASYVQELTGEDANIIFGAMYDDSVADYARITVIAIGLSDNAQASLSLIHIYFLYGARLNWLIRRERVKFLQLPEQTEKLQQQPFLEKSCQMHAHLYLLLEILELRILPSHWR